MPAKESLQKRVEHAVAGKFFLEEAIAEGVVNYRAAAKRLRREVGGGTIEAIAIALRRHAERGRTGGADRKIAALFSSSRVRARTGISDFTLVPGRALLDRLPEISRKIHPERGGLFQVVFGHEGATLIVDSEGHADAARALKGLIIDERKDLAAVSIITPRKVEDTVGWVAAVTRLLARHGINMVESLSCYTETILIIDENDLPRALEMLRRAKG